jgi:hypothetical protein
MAVLERATRPAVVVVPPFFRLHAAEGRLLEQKLSVTRRTEQFRTGRIRLAHDARRAALSHCRSSLLGDQPPPGSPPSVETVRPACVGWMQPPIRAVRDDLAVAVAVAPSSGAESRCRYASDDAARGSFGTWVFTRKESMFSWLKDSSVMLLTDRCRRRSCLLFTAIADRQPVIAAL